MRKEFTLMGKAYKRLNALIVTSNRKLDSHYTYWSIILVTYSNKELFLQ